MKYPPARNVEPDHPLRIPRRFFNFDTFFFIRALPNEYLIRIGKRKIDVCLGGEAFRVLRHYLKIPASTETTRFELECSSKNFMGIIVRGYIAWRIDPESVALAIRTLDFYDPDCPMEKTGFLITDMAKDAVRRSIAGLDVQEILNSSDILLQSIRAKLEDVHKWGIVIDTIGIDKIFIKSEKIFDDLQAHDRNTLHLAAEKSSLETAYDIEREQLDLSQQKMILTSGISETEFNEKAKQDRMRQEYEIEQSRLEAQKRQEKLAQENDYHSTVARFEAEQKDKQMRSEKEFVLNESLLEIENQEKKLKADEEIEERRFAFQRIKLDHDRNLQLSRVEIDMANLSVDERRRQVEAFISEREIWMNLIGKLKDVGALYGKTNLNIFSGLEESDILAPILRTVTALRDLAGGAVGGNGAGTGKTSGQDH